MGGNRLSRGLTLEGLSVSVFTRNANQYDTLLQMGRWFGYRPWYADLTRIYVDKDTADRFAELARVEEELRADIKKYAQEPVGASVCCSCSGRPSKKSSLQKSSASYFSTSHFKRAKRAARLKNNGLPLWEVH